MAATEAERLLRIARRDPRMALKLLDADVDEASWGWALQQTIEKTLKAWLHHLGIHPPRSHDITFAVQGRYDDEPEDLGLDRTAWCERAQALMEQVQSLLA